MRSLAFWVTVEERKKPRPNFLLCQRILSEKRDFSKSVHWFQLAIDEAKVQFWNWSSSIPSAWLWPSKIVVNMVGTVGYNNQLKQANQDFKFGVKNDVNKETKISSLRLNIQTLIHQIAIHQTQSIETFGRFGLEKTKRKQNTRSRTRKRKKNKRNTQNRQT